MVPVRGLFFSISPAPTKRVYLGLSFPAVFAAGWADEVRKAQGGRGKSVFSGPEEIC